MADLSKIQTAEPIEVTDDISKVAGVAKTNPASNANGLIVRNANRGQHLAVNSKGIVFATDIPAGTIWKIDGQENTYSASYAMLTLGASQINFASLTGANGVLVKVTRFVISFKNQTETSIDLKIEKYSTPPTGGTPIALTAVPHISTNPSASATAFVYSADPTPGNDVGGMRNWKINVPPSPEVAIVTLDFYYDANTRLCYLNNSNETLMIIWFTSVPLTLPNIDIWMEWTEQ